MQPLYQIFNLSQKEIHLMLSAIHEQKILLDKSLFEVPTSTNKLGNGSSSLRINYGKNYYFIVNNGINNNGFSCTFKPLLDNKPSKDKSWKDLFDFSNIDCPFTNWLKNIAEELDYAQRNISFHNKFHEKAAEFTKESNLNFNGVFSEEELNIQLPSAINMFIEKLNTISEKNEGIPELISEVKKLLERTQDKQLVNKKDFLGSYMYLIYSTLVAWGLEKLIDQVYIWFVESFRVYNYISVNN